MATAGGCSGGSGERTLATVTTQAVTTTTTSLPATTSTTVGAPATTSVTAPPVTELTPEDQAKAFYEAWSKGDQARAATLGEPAAVAAIFARPWSAADGWSFSECSGAAGSEICRWQGGSQELKLLVRGASGGLPVTVVDVRFG
ncbi:MAG: hypothetical protein M3011_10985 [Actinomycetota bacterium]|nr:hypothetical protein [Actinomycetota bacterium]